MLVIEFKLKKGNMEAYIWSKAVVLNNKSPKDLLLTMNYLDRINLHDTNLDTLYFIQFRSHKRSSDI